MLLLVLRVASSPSVQTPSSQFGRSGVRAVFVSFFALLFEFAPRARPFNVFTLTSSHVSEPIVAPQLDATCRLDPKGHADWPVPTRDLKAGGSEYESTVSAPTQAVNQRPSL